MSKLRSYPKVYTIGHRLIRNLFDGPVVVQEKVDGSQFSFGMIEGEFVCRSRNKEIWSGRIDPKQHDEGWYPEVDKMFAPAVQTAYHLYAKGMLMEGWIYRGEAITKPKHNTLEYSRIPEGGIVLFDIDLGVEDRMNPTRLKDEADRLGLEVVPCFDEGELNISSPDELKIYLERESFLGGPNIEGFVVKNYNRFNDQDGKMLMGKYVSEAFKEKHTKSWAKQNPSRNDVVNTIIDTLTTDARFEKAVQRRRDAGLLQGAPEDIGPIMADLMQDTETEEEDWIKEQLYAHFRKGILKGVTRGFPQWYKDRLLKEQFDAEVS